MSRYLALDHGERRIGIAISDPTLTIAQPLRTIEYQSEKQFLQELKNIISEYRIERLIVGLPITMKGTDSRKTLEVREFAERLSQYTGIPIEFEDERLTTVQAHQTLRQLGKKSGRNKQRIDQMAAQGILQTYLDRLKQRGKNE